MCSPSASRTSSELSITSSASDSEVGRSADALGAALLLGELEDVGVGLFLEPVVALDAGHAGGEDHREGQVGVAGRVERPVLEAGPDALLAALGHRHPHQRRAVRSGPRLTCTGASKPATSRL